MFERQGAEPMTSTPEEMLKHINAECGRFSQAIKLAGLTVQQAPEGRTTSCQPPFTPP